jgi:Protein of unknown function (DUF3179)
MSLAESGLPVESGQPQEAGRSRFKKLLIRAVMVPSVIVLFLFVAVQAGQLWAEWKELQDELFVTEQHGVIGFLNIAPVASFAHGPKDWYRVEGDQSYLWFGWEKNSGHRWFRFASGEIDPSRLQHPESQFIAQAIDFPVAESTGGKIFRRMPSETRVVGTKIESLHCAYPVAVLGKVIVINDIVRRHPYLVVLNPFAKQVVAFSIYDSLLDGHRITLAPTGYFQDGKPVLFDRGTESLWIEMHDGLTAMAGKLYRKRLMRVAIPSPVTWGTWISRNPDSRLLVGADRSLGIPRE